MDGTPGDVFARTAALARWGILAPPLARLQAELLGDVDEVFLTVEALADAAAPYRPATLKAR
jgi:hypothetical protein